MKHQHHPVEATENRCPRCNRPYDFWTEHGRLVGPAHPLGECNAPRYLTVSFQQITCSECPNIVGESRPGAATVTCSPACKLAREERLRLQRTADKSALRAMQDAEAKAFYEKRREARAEKKRRKAG